MLGVFKQFHRRSKKYREGLSKAEQNLLMEKISKAENFEDVTDLFNELYQNLIFPLWTSLNNKYSPPLSTEDMQDVCQDAWIKLLESRKKYDPANDVYSWVYVISKNLVLDKIRKIKRNDEYSSDIFASDDQEPTIINIKLDEIPIDTQMIQRETAGLIRIAIDNLQDETEKEIIKRRIIHENKIEQIADDLNLPLTTTYKKLKKGLSLLREQLNNEIYI